MKKVFTIVFLLVWLSAIGPSFGGRDKTPLLTGLVHHEKLTDGIYEGTYKAGPNKALVRVTIKGGKLVDIEIVKHRAWKGKKAESIIPMRIIDSQSTKVNAVTGATNSSRVIMKAVQRAIEKAYQQ